MMSTEPEMNSQTTDQGLSRTQLLWVFLLFLAVAALSVFFLMRSRFQSLEDPRDDGRDYKVKDSLTVLRRESEFPLNDSEGIYAANFVVEDITTDRKRLGHGYYTLASLEVSYFDVKGKKQELIIPIATYNEESNLMQVRSKQVVPVKDIYLNTDENNWRFWSSMSGIKKGQVISVVLMMPTEEFASASMQGFGFEVAEDGGGTYSQESLNEFYKTGDPNVFEKKTIWPVVDIFADSAINQINPDGSYNLGEGK